ncbi:MAG: BON domain-containing protein [Planctomycetota bacterium]
MRRKYLGLAIAAITALSPAAAFGGDREIAEQIMTRLKSSRDAGTLKNFTLDMKVDQGKVLFRGSVNAEEQKLLVLKAANGIEGINEVIDEVTVKAAAPQPKVARPPAKRVAVKNTGASIREMLAKDVAQTAEPAVKQARPALPVLEIAPGAVKPTAAVELAAPAAGGVSDQQVVAGVVKALGEAQKSGRLKGFGVDVKCSGGVVTLHGRASSQGQRSEIVRITEAVNGVQGVSESISVAAKPAPNPVPAQLASNRMAPVNVDPVPTMAAPLAPAYPAAAQMSPAPMMGTPVSGPVVGQPMPINYGATAGAPRYEAPNLPNYAWPGYSAYPNYAALTYPQQYSPSAWPYIGPFYPYPQVPLGWRRVSLEWDDGWWYLDFTDK